MREGKYYTPESHCQHFSAKILGYIKERDLDVFDVHNKKFSKFSQAIAHPLDTIMKLVWFHNIF